MSKLLTIQEVSGVMRVSDETVRRWVRRGVVPFITLPKVKGSHPVYRIREDTLNALIDDGYSEYVQEAAS